jgi:predicted DNA-binding protein YlxM (UPF0122 family)
VWAQFRFTNQKARCKVKSLDREKAGLYNALVVFKGGALGVQSDKSLEQRIRDGRLLDIYGSLLTEKQNRACEMVLLSDLSLSESADALDVSRQGVHDLVARAKERMESFESALGLLERDQRAHRLAELLEVYRERLPEDFYRESSALLR